KSVDLRAVLLAIWRLGAIYVPVFTGFATPAVELRVTGRDGKRVLTDVAQACKLLPLGSKPWEVVQVGGEQPAAPGWTLLSELGAEQRPVPESARVGADGVLIQLCTSGTTGTPKAVPVPVKALASMTRYLLDALDLRPDDVF